jgi:hypothetical protein
MPERLYCFPEIWDVAAGRTENNDYRNSKAYQHMLERYIIDDQEAWIVKYPHRLFFGVNHHHRSQHRGPGTLPISQFLDLTKSAIDRPTVTEAFLVREVLILKGLPVELAIRVMRFMNYEGKRRLVIPNDPFHPSNKGELIKYLKYCWKLLICCEVMANALGQHIDWRGVVAHCIVDLWDSAACDYQHWCRRTKHGYSFYKPRDRGIMI